MSTDRRQGSGIVGGVHAGVVRPAAWDTAKLLQADDSEDEGRTPVEWTTLMVAVLVWFIISACIGLGSLSEAPLSLSLPYFLSPSLPSFLLYLPLSLPTSLALSHATSR